MWYVYIRTWEQADAVRCALKRGRGGAGTDGLNANPPVAPVVGQTVLLEMRTLQEPSPAKQVTLPSSAVLQYLKWPGFPRTPGHPILLVPHAKYLYLGGLVFWSLGMPRYGGLWDPTNPACQVPLVTLGTLAAMC